MTALDKQMDEMLLEIKYLKSDKHVNGIKADGIEEAINSISNADLYNNAFQYYSDLTLFIEDLRNK